MKTTKILTAISILLLLILLAINVFGQNSNIIQDKKENYMSIHVGQSLLKTKSLESSILFGKLINDTDEIAIGPIYKRLYGNNGHNNNYYGASLYAQVSPQLLNSFFVLIKIDVLHGEYWMKKDIISDFKIVHYTHMIPEIGLGYIINNKISTYITYEHFTYDPIGYLKDNKDPFRTNEITIALKYNIML